MNTMIFILILVTVISTISIVVFILLSIKNKSYLSYQQKLIAFEERKKRIENEIEKERKGFRNDS